MASTNALRFFGVIDAHEATGSAEHPLPVDGVSVVRFRDLAAVVAPTNYARVKPGDAELEEYVRVVDELYKHGPIIPAPVGTVFRGPEVLHRWLEIHYAKLHETLGIIEQRATPNPPYDFVRMELGV